MNSATVVDYGVVNLRNILQGLDHVGANTQVTTDPELILKADRVILPGVGAFAAGVEELRSRNLDQALHAVVKKGRPLLGICLGMQMLLDVSNENGIHEGLGLIRGRVKPIPKEYDKSLKKRRKVPHIGWNKLNYPQHLDNWEGTCLEATPQGAYYYFVHSYMAVPDDVAHVLGYCCYEGLEIVGAIRMDNVTGLQFHPERSGPAGLEVLENFISS